MATSEEIEMVWNLLTVNYQYIQRQYTDEQLVDLLCIWKQLLSDVPGTALKAATLDYISKNKWFPSVAELRETAFGFIQRASGDEHDAFTGWQEALRNSHVWYPGLDPRYSKQITWSDPDAEMAAGIIGGLRAIKFCEERQLSWVQAQFVKAYNTIDKRRMEDERMLPQVRELLDRVSERMSLGHDLMTSARAELPEANDEWNG
jgi:hypothetical protein